MYIYWILSTSVLEQLTSCHLCPSTCHHCHLCHLASQSALHKCKNNYSPDICRSHTGRDHGITASNLSVTNFKIKNTCQAGLDITVFVPHIVWIICQEKPDISDPTTAASHSHLLSKALGEQCNDATGWRTNRYDYNPTNNSKPDNQTTHTKQTYYNKKQTNIAPL